ncbi:MAG: SDR family oxidoreductase [Steroidobacteraceae bacterium]
MNLQKKVVAITGGGRGLGRATALAFAARGSDIALLDLNAADLEETRKLVEAQGVRAYTHVTNVAQESDVTAALDGVIAELGQLDVLVNNAGITRDAMLVKVKDGEVVGKMSIEQWNAVIGVNLTGVFLCGREAAERMIRGGKGGVIINISSISADGNLGQTNYSAAKAGVASMTVVWAKELARFGIRCGAIAPGFCATDILSAMKPEVLEKVVAPVPLKRLGEPAEIAHTAIYIAENDFFTGRMIYCDGGMRF